ncbi:MAG: hypothetical protein II982_01725 [Clostridia bacterium]|nr:hypothetical protein [Clostridia bacterium]
MKKRILSVILSSALVISMCAAVNAEYGSADDPLVSLSYITDTLLPEIYGKVDEKIDEKIKDLPTQEVQTQSTDLSYVPLQMNKGQKVEAVSGSIEVLLRRGTFKAVDPLGDHLINMTDGTEAGEGQTLTLQNLYVIARPDGRAILADADYCWIMVRGDYKIS